MFSGSRRAAASVAILVSFVSVGAALADTVRLTTAGQDAARLMIVQRVDLGSGSGWTGGPVTPTPAKAVSCPGFGPKRVELVETGSAESYYSRDGLEFDSQAEVLKTARMVTADWQRTIAPPHVLPCLQNEFAAHLQRGEKLVSFDRISFPKVGTQTAAFRGVIDLTATGQRVRLAVDIVLFTTGRATLDLTTTTPLSAVATVRPAEIALTRDMLGRAESAAGIA